MVKPKKRCSRLLTLSLCLVLLPGSTASPSSFIDEENHTILTLCNSSPFGISAIVLHKDWNMHNQWLLNGWLSLPAQSCLPFGEIPRGKFYVFANSDAGGKYQWSSSSHHVCISTRPTLRVVYPNETCIQGEARVGFQEGEATARSYSYTFRFQ